MAGDDETDNWSHITAGIPAIHGDRPPAKKARLKAAFLDSDRQASIIRRYLQQDVENGGSPDLLRRLWTVSGLCESPIEDLLLLQMATRLYPSPGIFRTQFLDASVAPQRRLLQIVPQAKLGPYRADFLLLPGTERGILLECDGVEYHSDATRDARRDEYVAQTFSFSTLRIPGNAIMGSDAAIGVIAGIVAAASSRLSTTGVGWAPSAGPLKVNWGRRIASGRSFVQIEKMRRDIAREMARLPGRNE